MGQCPHPTSTENIMTEEEFGIREGEVAIPLPEKSDAGVYFIGRIRTPWTRREECPKNAREADAVCTLDVDPRYAAALTGVKSCSHLIVLYWMTSRAAISSCKCRGTTAEFEAHLRCVRR